MERYKARRRSWADNGLLSRTMSNFLASAVSIFSSALASDGPEQSRCRPQRVDNAYNPAESGAT